MIHIVKILCVISFFHTAMMCQRVKWQETVTKVTGDGVLGPTWRILITAWHVCLENDHYGDQMLLYMWYVCSSLLYKVVLVLREHCYELPF